MLPLNITNEKSTWCCLVDLRMSRRSFEFSSLHNKACRDRKTRTVSQKIKATGKEASLKHNTSINMHKCPWLLVEISSNQVWSRRLHRDILKTIILSEKEDGQKNKFYSIDSRWMPYTIGGKIFWTAWRGMKNSPCVLVSLACKSYTRKLKRVSYCG